MHLFSFMKSIRYFRLFFFFLTCKAQRDSGITLGDKNFIIKMHVEINKIRDVLGSLASQ